jgi:hypothetical protein
MRSDRPGPRKLDQCFLYTALKTWVCPHGTAAAALHPETAACQVMFHATEPEHLLLQGLNIALSSLAMFPVECESSCPGRFLHHM